MGNRTQSRVTHGWIKALERAGVVVFSRNLYGVGSYVVAYATIAKCLHKWNLRWGLDAQALSEVEEEIRGHFDELAEDLNWRVRIA